MKPIYLLFALPLLGTGCRTEQSAYLKKALSQLERIQRVAYKEDVKTYAAGDTIPRHSLRYYVEQRNRADTTLRHSYLSYLDGNDTTHCTEIYDGIRRIEVDHDRRRVTVDDFSVKRAPYRLTASTFFCRAEAILRYVLTTSDPIRTVFEPCGDGFRLRLDIDLDCNVTFFGRAYYDRPPREFFPDECHSTYEIRFDSRRMPCVLRYERSGLISVDSVFDVRIADEPQEPLRPEEHYPADYTQRKYRLRNGSPRPFGIVGRQAPDWTLVDGDSVAVSLGDFRSRVLLIQFTGVGCLPCQAAIPLLNSLGTRYAPSDVGVVAIETWGARPSTLGAYTRQKKIAYPLLAGTDEVAGAYLPDGTVPVFLLLDAKRRVHRALRGYIPAESDRTITEAIDSLLREQ